MDKTPNKNTYSKYEIIRALFPLMAVIVLTISLIIIVELFDTKSQLDEVISRSYDELIKLNSIKGKCISNEELESVTDRVNILAARIDGLLDHRINVTEIILLQQKLGLLTELNTVSIMSEMTCELKFGAPREKIQNYSWNYDL